MEENLLTLQNLPNEVLCQMIAGLESKNDIRGLLFTNKLFQELVYYSWSKLTLKYDNKLNYHSFLALPADRLHYLLELDISNCDRMTNALFKQILAKTPNLQVLRMKNCKRLTRVSLTEVVRKLPTLLALDIRGFEFGEARQLDDILVKQKCPALPLLREFRGSPDNFRVLFNRGLLTESITTLIITGELYLEHIKQFVNLKRLEFHYIPGTKDLDLTGCLPNLERLKMGPLNSLVLGNRPNLTHLSFAAEKNFNNASTLWPDVKNLKSLKVMLNSEDTPFSLKFFPKLEELNIDRCDVQELIDHKIFKKLELPFLTKENDAVNVIIANPNLIDVQLPSLDVTQRVLDALTQRVHLRKLSVHNLSDVNVTRSLTWSKLTALKHLTLIPPFRFIKHEVQWGGGINNTPNYSKDSVLWNIGIKHIPNLEVLSLWMTHDSVTTTNQSDWAMLPQQIHEGFKSLKRLVVFGPVANLFESGLNSSTHVNHLNYLKVTRTL